jgi:membrane fusion protein (multidrug efflux system)
VDNKLLTAILVLILALFSTVQLGCNGADHANAASENGGDGQAEPASERSDEDGEEGEDEKKKEEAVPVEVVALERGPIESVLSFSSNLEAESQVQVFSQAKRLITQLLVEEGDRVRKNQVLLRLQDDEQRSALAKTKSQLEKAQREHERQKRLFTQELISEQTFNESLYELEQLSLSLEDAERELGYTEVRAPISGTVTQRMVNLGDQVQIGQHLFDIVDFDSMVARIYVPEQHLELLRGGMPTRISAKSNGGTIHTCKVKRIAPIVDPRSGTVKLTVDVGGREGLRPGMYVDVELITATNPDAVLLPKRALIYDNDQIFVYRLTDDRRVERVFVEAALTDKHNVEPADGLGEGDQVVVAGQAGLKDGALVRLPGDKKNEDASSEAEDEEAPATERASL